MNTLSENVLKALAALEAACVASRCEQATQANCTIVAAPPQRIDTDDEWREPFCIWMSEECAFSNRLFGSISDLHISYCEWEVARDGVPCTRTVFECLLRWHELVVSDGMVAGLMLRRTVHDAGYAEHMRIRYP